MGMLLPCGPAGAFDESLEGFDGFLAYVQLSGIAACFGKNGGGLEPDDSVASSGIPLVASEAQILGCPFRVGIKTLHRMNDKAVGRGQCSYPHGFGED